MNLFAMVSHHDDGGTSPFHELLGGKSADWLEKVSNEEYSTRSDRLLKPGG